MRRPVAKAREHEQVPPPSARLTGAAAGAATTAHHRWLGEPAAGREKDKATPARSRLIAENVLAEGRKRARDAESTGTVGAS